MRIQLVFAVATSIGAIVAPNSAVAEVPPTTVAKADTAGLVKVGYAPAGVTREASLPSTLDRDRVLVFTAPPRESPEQGQAIYGPIADYLTQMTGRRITYRHPGTWGVYRSEMLSGNYDLVFDGPHFNAWRAERMAHNVLVKAPKEHEFAIIARADQPYTKLSQMAGRTFCAHAPPNLGTLVLLSQFDNPSRQPMIINTKGWENIYRGVAAGQCAGAIIPSAVLKQLDASKQMKVLYRSQPMPNQAFSAGPRVPPEDQRRIAEALLAPQALAPTARLRETFKIGERFAAASNREFAGIGAFLKNEWGYY